MSRLYLVTFDESASGRQPLLHFLDRRDEIADWHSSMTNGIFIVTDVDVTTLRDLLKESPLKRFIAVEIRPQDVGRRVSGFLPRATWDFIKRKQPAE